VIIVRSVSAGHSGQWYDLWPSWKEFWANPPQTDEPEVAAPAPLNEFLVRMRRNSDAPKIRVR
jgi:hypothetical protein